MSARARLADLVSDAAATLRSRWTRTVPQALGIGVGAGLFVFALSMGNILAAQVDESFDALKSNVVRVEPSADDAAATTLDGLASREAVSALHGTRLVRAAGRIGTADDIRTRVSDGAVLPPNRSALVPVAVIDPEVLELAEVRVTGSSLHAVDEHVGRDVALLGRALAARLGIDDAGGYLQVGAHRLQVIGLLEDVTVAPQLLSDVVVSARTAARVLPDVRLRPSVLVRTRPGAAPRLAASLPLRLRPDGPDRVQVVAPPQPGALQDRVGGTVRLLALVSAVAILALGTFAAANLMLLSITSRIPELGMRRALGASRAEIFGGVLAESTLLGTSAGVAGSLVGTWCGLAVCIARSWLPVISPAGAATGIAIGAAAGALGGFVPALVAVRISPAAALRQ